MAVYPNRGYIQKDANAIILFLFYLMNDKDKMIANANNVFSNALE